MAYDARDGYVLMFGGATGNPCGSQAELNDTWEFKGGIWTQVPTSRAPSPRQGASMAYDAHDGYIVLFGGYDGSGGLGDTWAFSGGTWTQLNIPGPGSTWEAAMSYDPATGYVLLFSGVGAGQDTWEFQSGVWSQLSPASSPPSRSDAMMAPDPSSGDPVLYGGGGIDDAWSWDGTTWTQLPTPAAGARNDGGMDLDLAQDFDLVFGGQQSSCNGLSDTWSYASGTWTSLAVSGPAARAWTSLAYDAADGYSLLFGGWDSATSTDFQDTWVFAAPPPSVTSFACSPASLDLGQQVTCTAALSGGTGSPTPVFSGTGCSFTQTGDTFSCTPTSAGTFHPFVTATDSLGRTVNASSSSGYNVVPDPAASATASPTTTDVGSSVSFAATVTSGGQGGPYVYAWQLGDGSTANTQAPSHAYLSAGNFTACVNVTDSTGMQSTVPGCAQVRVDLRPAIATFTASPASIVLGSGTAFLVVAYRGTGTLNYAYSGLPPGCTSVDTPSLTCTPSSSSGSPFSIHVFVNDTIGDGAQSNTSLTVLPSSGVTLASVSISPSSVNMGVGTPLRFSSTALDSTGSPIYSGISFGWSLSPGTLGTLNSTTGPLVQFTAGPSAGTGTLTVTATYGTTSKTSTVTITVSSTPAPALAIASFKANPGAIYLGSSTSIQVLATGGIGSLSYYYSGLPPGCATPSPSVSSFKCTPTALGTYNVSLTVADHAGHSVQSWLTLTVLAPTPVTTGGTDWTPYILASVAILAIAVVLLFLILRRRKPARGAIRGTATGPGYAGSWTGAPPEPPPDPAAAAPSSFGVPSTYYAGVTFAQAPDDWNRDPLISYGTYRPTPPPAPEPLPGLRGPNLAANGYRPWALKINADGIDVEDLGRQRAQKGPFQDAAFHRVEEDSAVSTPQFVQTAPSPADAYVILYGLAQRPRSIDALKQMVPLTDDAVAMLLQALEKAKLVAHGSNNTTKAVVYAITPAGRQLTKRALTAASEAVRPEPAGLPAPSGLGAPAASIASQVPSATPKDAERKVPPSTPQKPPVKAVDVGGFHPQDVNPKAQNVPQGAYQAWSADILGGTANVHEIGGQGAKHEAEERERIRKLLESWKGQKRSGMR